MKVWKDGALADPRPEDPFENSDPYINIVHATPSAPKLDKSAKAKVVTSKVSAAASTAVTKHLAVPAAVDTKIKSLTLTP